MEYPFGHTHHHLHHTHRRDDDEESGGYPSPPPPFSSSSPYPPPPFSGGAYPHGPPDSYPPPSSAPYGGGYHHPPPPESYPPPPESYPPPVSGVYHSSHTPHLEPQGYAPPPPAAGIVSHTHHSAGGHEGGGGHHHFQPHMPSFIEGHFHHGNRHGSEGGVGPLMEYFAKKPTFRVYCKAGGDRYTIGVRDGKVVLTQHNPDDPTQHWYKDEKWSTKVKDEDGYPSFSLVNKATGQAIKHSIAGDQVRLIPYKPDEFNESILWTESKDLGNGFRTVRMVNDVKLCMDAFHGDEGHGGVHDGTPVALYDCWKGDNQQWKIVPYSH